MYAWNEVFILQLTFFWYQAVVFFWDPLLACSSKVFIAHLYFQLFNCFTRTMLCCCYTKFLMWFTMHYPQASIIARMHANSTLHSTSNKWEGEKKMLVLHTDMNGSIGQPGASTVNWTKKMLQYIQSISCIHFFFGQTPKSSIKVMFALASFFMLISSVVLDTWV